MNLFAQVKVEAVGPNESITLVLAPQHYQYDGVSSELASEGELFEVIGHVSLGLFKVSSNRRVVGHGETFREVEFQPLQLNKTQARLLKKLKVCQIKFSRYL